MYLLRVEDVPVTEQVGHGSRRPTLRTSTPRRGGTVPDRWTAPGAEALRCDGSLTPSYGHGNGPTFNDSSITLAEPTRGAITRNTGVVRVVVFSYLVGMINRYEIQGTPTTGYSMRCPHKLNITVPVRLTTKQQRRRYGLNRPTVEKPLFVGAPDCMNCLYSLTRYYTPMGERSPFVLCSFPVYSYDVPRDILARLRAARGDV